MASIPTGQEKQYYDQLFDLASKDDSGLLPGRDALPFLVASGLPQQTLGEIWTVADPDNNGFLTRETWYKAARLVGWLQKGGQHKVDNSLASKAAPYPTFNGYPGPPAQIAPPVPLSAHPTGETLAPLTPSDRTQFTRIFVGCGPSNGLVTGDKARDVFLKSKLDYDKLGQIWNLADTQQRGALDLPDFIIGMWLIRNCMANPSISLPLALPPGAYEAASGGRAATAPLSVQNTGPTSPIQRQMTGTLQPQLTGQSLSTVGGVPARSGSIMTPPSRQAPYSSPAHAAPWDITPDAKATSDRFFGQLDPQNKGVIDGDVAVPFMLQSQLDEASLATIWDLADIRQEGKLDRDEFAVAMHLISSKLAGKDLPTALPTSLIPPALRSLAAAPASTQAQPSSTAKDLFDLFDDPPAQQPPMAAATAFLPQPPSRRPTQEPTARRQDTGPSHASPVTSAVFSKPSAGADLLGDDAQGAASSSVHDSSAEIGNKRNQLANTNRSNADLERNRADLEQQNASNSSQLQQLESELSLARAKYEEETKVVAELRIRVGEQTAKLRQLQGDVISAQSDLTARKMEKDELEQSYLRDKEEVRGLQKRMKELEDEKTGIKLLLEKVKKDARQQKGMVSIAKKQLSTAEGSRDGLQQELRDAEQLNTAEEMQVSPAAATPRALSPEATGASQRSHNPFDRFARKRSTGSNSGSEYATPVAGSPAKVGGAVGAAALGGVAAAVLSGHHGGSIDEQAGPNFGLPLGRASEFDAFGAHIGQAAPAAAPANTDPFGASTDAGTGATGAGFGDSFDTRSGPENPSDFDAAFADFDTGADVPAPQAQLESQAPIHGDATGPQDLGAGAVPLGVTKSSALEALPRPEAERTASTQALPPSSAPASPPLDAPNAGSPEDSQTTPTAARVADAGAESSDEDEGPEDLEGPRRGFAATPDRGMSPPAVEASTMTRSPPASVMSAHHEEAQPKTRRSAPPPPAVRSPQASSPVAVGSADPFAPAVTSPVILPTTTSPRPSVTLERTTSPTTLDQPQPPSMSHPPGMPQPPSQLEQDPFGGPSTSSFAQQQQQQPGGAAANQFDDDGEFDFSDMPPTSAPAPAAAQHQAPAPANASFDDEFANFDDEFDRTPSQFNTGSDNTNSTLQSYEVVQSPNQNVGTSNTDEWGFSGVGGGGPQPPQAGGFANFSFDDAFGAPAQQPTASAAAVPGPPAAFDDAFGAPVPVNAALASAAASGAPHAPAPDTFSFDDAFGNDFAGNSGPSNPAVPPAAPDAALPSLPKRPSVNKEPTSDLPQTDDLEDVKRLCGMGFSRTLVVEALDANGYDFQKALNVLLVK